MPASLRDTTDAASALVHIALPTDETHDEEDDDSSMIDEDLSDEDVETTETSISHLRASIASGRPGLPPSTTSAFRQPSQVSAMSLTHSKRERPTSLRERLEKKLKQQ